MVLRLTGIPGGVQSFLDSNFTLQDDGDTTRQGQFQLSGITSGNTRTLTWPDASGTIALLSLAQTWSATQTFAGINATSLGATTPGTGAFSTISATGAITSTLATGTAPFTVASTTVVANLNASQLLGGTWAIPGAIGSTTRNTLQATTGDFNSTLNVTGAITASSTLKGVTAQLNGQTSLSAAATSSWGAPLVMAAGSSIQYGGIAVGANASPCYLYLGKTRAASGTGSTLLTTGDELVELTGLGANGTGFIESCSMKYFCEGTVSSSAMPGRIEFWTTAAGAASTTKRLSIDSAGTATFVNNVVINGTLQLGAAYAAGVVTATGTIAIKDNTGTTYNFLVKT